MNSQAIPEFIRTFTFEGYTNAFHIEGLNQCPRLYGTETLFGDWDSRILLLAKDAAPTHVIRGLAKKGDKAWRHAEKGDAGGWRTNNRLNELTQTLGEGKKLLYGSATANMLCDNPKWSRSLPGFWKGDLHDYLKKTLLYTINRMPNLRNIACLGAEAWYLTCCTLNLHDKALLFKTHRDQGIILTAEIIGSVRRLDITAHYHPAARVSNDAIRQNWNLLKLAQ